MMSRKKTYLILLLCCLLVMADACVSKEPQPAAAAPVELPKHTFSQKGSVTEMTIMPEEVDLPEGAGKAEFVSYCGICHSLKYVLTQPVFTRTTWQAEVHKMVEKYGAPIDSANSDKIVDYIVSINNR
jgi:mono/diheme cytochrome c family protein